MTISASQSVELTYKTLIKDTLFFKEWTDSQCQPILWKGSQCQPLLQLKYVEEEDGQKRLALAITTRQEIANSYSTLRILIEKIKQCFGFSNINLKNISNFLNSKEGTELLKNVMDFAETQKKSFIFRSALTMSARIEILNSKIKKQRKNHLFFKANEVSFLKGKIFDNPYWGVKHFLDILGRLKTFPKEIFLAGDRDRTTALIELHNTNKKLNIRKAHGTISNDEILSVALALKEAIADIQFFPKNLRDEFIPARPYVSTRICLLKDAVRQIPKFKRDLLKELLNFVKKVSDHEGSYDRIVKTLGPIVMTSDIDSSKAIYLEDNFETLFLYKDRIFP